MASLGLHLLSIAHKSSSSLCSSASTVLVKASPIFTSSVMSDYVPPFIGFRVAPRTVAETIVHPLVYDGPDPAPIFMDHRVHSILKTLTGCNHSKVFRHRKIQVIKAPTMHFLTDEQLKEAQEQAAQKAEKLLQMPPVVKVHTTKTEVLSYDPALSGLSNDRMVFTDISLGVADGHRLIVVREPDGTLRKAFPEERHRMNEIYNPRKGRTLHTPAIFTRERLQDLFSREEFEFVLDRTCVQMEPDDPSYQSVLADTYEAVDRSGLYDRLLSTRHYGPMVFFLVWHRRLDGLLESYVKTERFAEAGAAVRLHILVHPDSSTAQALASREDEQDSLHLLKTYISSEPSHSSRALELTLKAVQDLQKSRKEFEEQAAAARGLGQVQAQ